MCCSVMDNVRKTVTVFEQADSVLNDISQEVSHPADVASRQYISVLKEALARIKKLKV